MITKENTQSIFPLTSAQKGMLYHLLVDPETQAYFIQTIYRIKGDFDQDICKQTWDVLLKRHELLRSSFITKNPKEPLQLILIKRPVEFIFDDLSALDPVQQNQVLLREQQQDRSRGFDLRNDSLVRVRVYRLDDSRYQMIWSYSHLLLDGWSGSLLQSDFVDIYSSLKHGREPAATETLSYNTYWDWLESRDFESARKVWQDYLASYNEIAIVPHLKKVSKSQQYKLALHTFSLSHDLSLKIIKIAQDQGVTLNTVIKCIWGILVGYYNNTDDVIFGTVVSGRPPEIKGINQFVGMFINTIPIRIHWRKQEAFSGLVKQVQNEAIQLCNVDFLPLTDIQSLYGNKQEYFGHLFVFENYPSFMDANESALRETLGFTVDSVESIEQAHYDFGILVHAGEQITVTLHHNQWVYEEEEMQRIEGHFRKVVDEILHYPSKPITQLQIITDTEKNQIINQFSGIGANQPNNLTIVYLWEEQVRKTPDCIAIQSESQSLTYAQVNQSANQIAHHLIHQYGLKKEEFAAVFFPQNEWLIISLLAIMKAGGAYLPLDAGYPEERINFILQDSGCRLILSSSELSPLLNVSKHCQIIDPASINNNIQTNIPNKIDENNLAYIIYTSGSTGIPKGVLIEHGAFINMIREQIRVFGIKDQDRILQAASCAFDASLSEIFMTLLSGSILVLLPSRIKEDITLLHDYITEQNISVMTFPPSLLNAFEKAEFPTLRVMLTAGEAVNIEDALHYRDSCRFFNAYGPTENSVCTCMQPVHPDKEYPYGIPIGFPLANINVFIVDRFLRPAPIGAPGEICISGKSLARGYLNRPEINDEKFLNIELTEKNDINIITKSNRRLYRSGDVGRWLPDGSIDFIGRIDSQVKIRGYRIELGELEACLMKHQAVREAVAIVNQQQNGIIACCVLNDQVDEQTLRIFMKKRIPHYMIPSKIIFLPAIPLTSNGKVDRKQLFKQVYQELCAFNETLLPQNQLQKSIADVWSEVLNNGKVSINQSFFDLGGDSLKAIQVVNRLRKQKIHIRLRDLIEFETITKISENLKQSAPVTNGFYSKNPVPLTPIQQSFFDHSEEHHRNLCHIYSLRTIQRLNEDALNQTLNAILDHHDALRMQFIWNHDSIMQQPVQLNGLCQIEKVDLMQNHGAITSLKQTIEEQYCNFDLSQPPFLKAVLFRLPDCDVLSLIIHHCATDAVSGGILLDDWIEAYQQILDHKSVQLPPPTSSYFQWADQLQHYSKGQITEQEINYWRKIDDAHSSNIPCDFDTGAMLYGQTDVVSLQLSKNETADFLNHSPKKNALVGLLAALSSTLGQWLDGSTIRITLSGHGRQHLIEDIDVSRTVGWFTANYPFLLNVEERKESIHQRLMDVPGGGIGYGLLHYFPSHSNEHLDAEENQPQISVNYIGEISTQLPNTDVSCINDLCFASIDRSFKSSSLLAIEAMIIDGQLEIGFRYHQTFHKPDTIKRFVGLFKDDLSNKQ